MKFILGKKVGMTSITNEDGNVIPVTVISAGPCFVTQVKEKNKDGYQAIQIGYGEKKKIKKPQLGHLKKSQIKNPNIKNLSYFREFRIDDEKLLRSFNLGDEIKVDMFDKGDEVKISGTRKAKGFSGVIKRWGFKSHPSSHGHPHQRRPGSIGSMFPQRVFKGKKMPGRKGPEQKTVLNLEVVDVDKENNLLLVKGSLPGVRGSLVEIRGR